MSEQKRLFFAVNLPAAVKEEIAAKLLPLIPADKWRKVPEENMHITMLFLGYMPSEAVEKLQQQTKHLQETEQFEAELSGVGDFNGRVLWIGVSKGTEQLQQLCKKLQDAVGVKDPKFHAHITLARNKGAEKRQAQAIAEKIGKEMRAMKIMAKSVELMESGLGDQNPKYGRLFSIPFAQGPGQPF